MVDDPKARADAALDAAVWDGRLADPRPFYRPALKYLREREPAGFREALRHFEEVLVPAVAAGADPAQEWRRYGQLLAEQMGAGRTVAVEPSGRARQAAEGGAAADSLVLHLPDAADAPPLVLSYPVDPSPAQGATFELLVLGRQTASMYES